MNMSDEECTQICIDLKDPCEEAESILNFVVGYAVTHPIFSKQTTLQLEYPLRERLSQDVIASLISWLNTQLSEKRFRINIQLLEPYCRLDKDILGNIHIQRILVIGTAYKSEYGPYGPYAW